MKRFEIVAGFNGKYDRIVDLEFTSRNAAETKLNRCLGKPIKENVWIDKLGQEFTIKEIEE